MRRSSARGCRSQTLYDLGQTPQSRCATSCAAKIADLEPRLAQVEERLKQLGPAPAKDAPPESAAIADERARLPTELERRSTPLKQARLLAARADQIAEQITEQRRAAYARQLFAQSPSVLSPIVWLDSAHALGERARRLRRRAARWADLRCAPENLVAYRRSRCSRLLALGIAMVDAVALVAAAAPALPAPRRHASARRWPRSARSLRIAVDGAAHDRGGDRGAREPSSCCPIAWSRSPMASRSRSRSPPAAARSPPACSRPTRRGAGSFALDDATVAALTRHAGLGGARDRRCWCCRWSCTRCWTHRRC